MPFKVVTLQLVPASSSSKHPAPTPNKGDVAWMMVATILVLLMILPGLAVVSEILSPMCRKHIFGGRFQMALPDFLAQVRARLGSSGAECLQVGRGLGVELVNRVQHVSEPPAQPIQPVPAASSNPDPDFILSFSWPAPVAKFMHDADTQRYAPPQGYLSTLGEKARFVAMAAARYDVERAASMAERMPRNVPSSLAKVMGWAIRSVLAVWPSSHV